MQDISGTCTVQGRVSRTAVDVVQGEVAHAACQGEQAAPQVPSEGKVAMVADADRPQLLQPSGASSYQGISSAQN
jgi:hypothetical protein